jgi:hypothetical protein
MRLGYLPFDAGAEQLENGSLRRIAWRRTASKRKTKRKKTPGC